MKYRDQNNFYLDNFLSNIARAPWYMVEQSTDPKMALAIWYGLFEQVLNVHALIRRKVKHWLQPEWIKHDIFKVQFTTEIT